MCVCCWDMRRERVGEARLLLVHGSLGGVDAIKRQKKGGGIFCSHTLHTCQVIDSMIKERLIPIDNYLRAVIKAN